MGAAGPILAFGPLREPFLFGRNPPRGVIAFAKLGLLFDVRGLAAIEPPLVPIDRLGHLHLCPHNCSPVDRETDVLRSDCFTLPSVAETAARTSQPVSAFARSSGS